MRSNLHPLLSGIAVFYFSFFSSISAKAQAANDSLTTDSAFYSNFEEQAMLYDSVYPSKPINFNLFQRYQPQYEHFPYLRVGNPGHAMYSPLLSSMVQPTTFNSSNIGPYLPYFDSREKMRYYNNHPPYTALYYMSGAKKEESIDVLHARNFGDNLNVSLHLNRKGSVGFYNHLKTSTAYFSMNTNYKTSNNRYTMLAHYYFNRKDLQENGGFSDLEIVENPETVGSSRLSNASNFVRDEGFLLSQTIGVGNTADSKAKHIKPLFRLGYDLELNSSMRRYVDNGDNGALNTSFYPDIFYDSSLTKDTTQYVRFTNQFNLYLYPGNQQVKFFYKNELIDYNQSDFIDSVYSNHIVGTQFSAFLLKEYKSRIDANYVFEGFRKNDLDLSVDFRKRRADTVGKPEVLTTFHYNLRSPQFKQQRYESNNFSWLNDFKQTGRLGVSVAGRMKGYELSADVGTLSNYIYYSENLNPVQYDEGLAYLAIGIGKRLNFGNFHLDNRLMYQKTSEEKVLPIPNFMVNESVYFQNKLFNDVVTFQVGFDLLYFTGYNGLAYMPAIGEFHRQNTDIIGNYPFVDFYLNFWLKRAFFFVKMEHINQGLAGNNYFQIPDYPVPPRSFKWGIKWTMFD